MYSTLSSLSAQILVFGGNDVTAQYKMIHHTHSNNYAHHLSKLTAVGTVSDFVPEYKFDTPFEKEIKAAVSKIVKRGEQFGTWGYLLRAAFYITLFATLQYLWVTTGSTPTLAFALGAAGALIGLNVQHDANHGAASPRPWVNELLGFGADAIGGSKYTWIEQHWTHHAYTNHPEKDGDAISAERKWSGSEGEEGRGSEHERTSTKYTSEQQTHERTPIPRRHDPAPELTRPSPHALQRLQAWASEQEVVPQVPGVVLPPRPLLLLAEQRVQPSDPRLEPARDRRDDELEQRLHQGPSVH